MRPDERLTTLAAAAGIAPEPKSFVPLGDSLLAAGVRDGLPYCLAAAASRRALPEFAEGVYTRGREGTLAAAPASAENLARLRRLLPRLAPALLWEEPAPRVVDLGDDPEAARRELDAILWRRFAEHDFTPFTTEFRPARAADAIRSGACRFRLGVPAFEPGEAALPSWAAECAGRTLLRGGRAVRVSAEAAAAAGRAFGDWAKRLERLAAALRPELGDGFGFILDPAFPEPLAAASYICFMRELRRHPSLRCAWATPPGMSESDRARLAAFAAPARLLA